MTRASSIRFLLVLAAVLSISPISFADNTPQSLPFHQDWSNTGLITADDNWAGVPGIVGFRGDGLTGGTAVNPQTVVTESTVVDVNANFPNPNVFATGGVTEFHIANPVVALQGSGTARAPYLQFHINTTGQTNINVSYSLRDIDGAADNSVQPIALQFRVGSTGNFTNVPAGFVADASTGPSIATLVTAISVTLPAAADNKPLVQVRVITTDAVGSDEWIGIDDISITGSGGPTPPSGVGAANPNSVAVGGSTLLTVAVTPGGNPTSTNLTVAADLSPIGGSTAQQFFDDGASGGDTTAGDNVFSFTATVATGTTGGAKVLIATINDGEARTATANIALTILAPTSPTGTGSANPNSVQAGDSTLFTVNVTPGANPPSTGISVAADLSSVGGSTSQFFAGSGNTFTFQTTVTFGTTPGVKTLPVTISDAEGRTGSTSISLTIEQPPPPLDHVVISQVYGGGGNTGATFRNDYVELFNPSNTSFDLAGWTLQYASAGGSSWTNNQPLGGVIAPGEYFLISLASGGAVGATLPEANISGEINMSATAGKIGLVRNGVPLSGPCPIGDLDIVDFVGYGTTASCREGTTNAPAPSNTTALFRRNNGFLDTNQNGTDFITGVPQPRITAPITEIGPSVFTTDPFPDAAAAPRDASITVFFTEPVDVVGIWYDISCATTGPHNDATFASFNSGKSHVITPNVNFLAGEQCTVTVRKDFIHDQDLDDSAPNTDTPALDYVWTFTVATGTAPPFSEDVHLAMGNPSDAEADTAFPNNYLMVKPEFALSYDRDRGTPNWVSWHLSDEWVGTLTRVDTFRADPAVPANWYRVQGTDFFASGFDRGHMVPNADRDKETSIPINQATFLMTNMMAQAPDNNQGPWANLENFLRTLLPANEIYIVAGGAGSGGTGASGFATTIADGRVAVPAFTWKVALVLPKSSGSDVDDVTAGARTIAVIMPNIQGIRTSNPSDWMAYLKTVDQVEALTGYDFFENVEDIVENAIEAGINGVNPPGVANQSASTSEDEATTITLNAVSSNTNPLTYTILNNPSNGTLSGSGNSRTYTPAPDFNGTDSFTFRVSDGVNNSNTATVNISVAPVNDVPTIAPIPDQTVHVGNTLTFTAIGSDIDVPAQTLTYSLAGAVPVPIVSPTFSSAGVFAWTPSGADAGVSFTFTVVVSDGVGSASTSVNVSVVDNTAPVISSLALSLTQLWPANHKMVDITVSYTATDMGDPAPTCSLLVSSNEPVDAIDSGNTAPDWEILDAHRIRLRAERSGVGTGRTYTVTASCVDRFLNASQRSAFVFVPLSQGK